ncbi:DUF3164 family protein [Pseudomonas aeruginosa]|uniref:DUF3164 family protein n=1 Tax=Pseudomonas aeruginosa TaxID=287 RepID=UPI0003D3EC7B|nr:sulfate transporter [Pseudomonas aeruginosa VRFPA08]
MTEYNAFRVELADKIAHVQINRPDKINAMNQDFWREIIEIFRWVDDTDEVRVVVLSGAGKHFSSGIDLMLLEGARAEVITLINDAFRVDQAGNIRTGSVLALRRLQIEDERWQRAMQAIGEAVQVVSTKAYVRIQERVGDTDQYRSIPLDIAGV